jgi:hypothetical protein
MICRIRPLLLAPLLAAAALPARPLAAQVVHAAQPGGWAHVPATPGAMRARLRNAVDEFRRNAPVPRLALFDMALPVDSAEADATGGYALVEVTVLVQDSTELPLARVYLRTAAGEVPLPVFRSRLSATRAKDDEAAAVFGRFRQDALYLLPLRDVYAGADLLIDYAAHRKGFGLATWSGGALPPDAPALPRSAPRPPGDAALDAFARREYPEFFAQ